MIRTVALLLVASAGVTAGSPTRVPADVYVLAGQSNMSGRGVLAALTAAERAVDPRIRLYGNDGRWRDAREPLDDATDQRDAVSADRQAGVGPGMAFARRMLRLRRAPIALVPCAKGGSAIAAWAPATPRDTLYGACLARMREAGGRPAGLLWYQGEADARDAGAGAWRVRFTALVAAWRRDLDAPRLPIVFVRIADRPALLPERYPGWAAVQAEQDRVSIDCVAMVSAAGLPRNADDLHLTTDAQRTLGARLATAMAALRGRGCR